MSDRDKIILMGLSGGGKTSMHSMIFSNFLASTARFGPTLGVGEVKMNFLGNFTLRMWDCGGQLSYREEYMMQRREVTFSNTALLIYTVDLSAYAARVDILDYFQKAMTAVLQCSPRAKLVVFLHKVDLIRVEERPNWVQRWKEDLLARLTTTATVGAAASDDGNRGGDGGTAIRDRVVFYTTSIYDGSLFDAWGDVMKSVLPCMDEVMAQLQGMLESLEEAVELSVLERTTLLAIAKVTKPSSRLSCPASSSNVCGALKKFRLASQQSFETLRLSIGPVTGLLLPFGRHTFLLAVLDNNKCGHLSTALAEANILAGLHLLFQRLSPETALYL